MELKELIRAAQQAEIHGDLPRAVELLRKAEERDRETGNAVRADRMARHALRLEAIKEAPPHPELSAPLDRGPVPALEALQAWCSFCCRPRSEVGKLITGPTDAFICRACATESLRLLEG